MGRIVYADEKLQPDILKLAKTEGFIPGLILGQNSGQKDYVIHLARTPCTSEKENENKGDADAEDLSKREKIKSFRKVTDIDDHGLALHAKQVTRMLPGGMCVLGIFIVGPGDIFADTSCHPKLRLLLHAISESVGYNTYLFGNGDCSEKLILHFSSNTQKYSCKSYDVAVTGPTPSNYFRPVEWKFQGNHRWHQVECQYDFDQFATYQVTKKRSSFTLREQLQEIVSCLNENVHKAICTIDGELKEDSSSLEVTDKNNKSKTENSLEDKVLQANLYVPYEPEVLKKNELNIVNLIGQMKCTGVLSSKVFLIQKALVKDAVKAVKEDIIRSWAARLEMHWDSLVEEEVGTPDEVMVVHEPPRRVLIPLPHSKIALCDYLFPGEGPSEALISTQDLLGIKVNESLVQTDFEGQPDIQNLTSRSEPSKSDTNVATSGNSGNSSFIIVGILLAFIVLIISLAIRLYLNSFSN